MKSHEEEVNCDICGNTLKNDRVLKDHIKSVHENTKVLNTKNILLTQNWNASTPNKIRTPPSTPPLTPNSNSQTTPKSQIQTPNSHLHTPESYNRSSGKKRKASDNLSSATVKRRGNYLMEQIEDLCDKDGDLKKFVLRRRSYGGKCWR